MKFERICIALTIIYVAIIGTASADIIGDCILTGYSYMNGQGSETSTPDDHYKNYFVATPLSLVPDHPDDMWGMSWVKFDVLSTETVNSAYLVVDLLGVGAMSFGNPAPASEDLIAKLDVYSPGDIDVANVDAYDNRDSLLALKQNLLTTDAAVSSITMTSNGTYSIDITDLYNGWVADPYTNNGLVLASAVGWEGEITQDNLFDVANRIGSVYASFGRDGANAPYISTTPIPEPMSLLLMGIGASVLLKRRKA